MSRITNARSKLTYNPLLVTDHLHPSFEIQGELHSAHSTGAPSHLLAWSPYLGSEFPETTLEVGEIIDLDHRSVGDE